jgi:hypothetical protein
MGKDIPNAMLCRLAGSDGGRTIAARFPLSLT